MVNLSSIEPFKALVIGDFMLDAYTTGRVRRVSPEAPVLIMEVEKLESRPGGAGNVVLNLAALGATVFACGRIGLDADGDSLRQKLRQQAIDTSGFISEANYKTPIKNRFVANSQQLLRVDFETIAQLQDEYEDQVIEYLEQAIPAVQVVAISDYGKGFLTPRLLASAIRLANQASVPIVIDPKGADFTKYKDAYLIKPNLSEAYAAARLPATAPLEEVASEILKQTQAQLLLITRSEDGITLFGKNLARADFPVRSKEIKDVTGAGDTVLSLICLGLANQLPMDLTIQLANIAAGLAIEHIGCVQVTLPEIAHRLQEFDQHTTATALLSSLLAQTALVQ